MQYHLTIITMENQKQEEFEGYTVTVFTPQTEIVPVPAEIEELSLTVSTEKRNEVVKVISDIFKGTDHWAQQIETIKVTSEDDALNIKLAAEARKLIKKARLEAEKIFDAKRSEVQSKMLDFQTEDKLWLKSKQIAQIKFKHLEDKMEHEETFLIRLAQEKRAARTAERMLKVSQFTSEMTEEQVRDLDDSVFDAILEGLKVKKAEAEAKAQLEELERIKAQERAELVAKRRLEFAPYLQYLKTGAVVDFGDDSVDFDAMLEVLKKRHADKLAADEALRIENEKLKQASELLNQKLAKEAEEAEKAKKEADAILEAERKKANEERVKQAQEMARLQAELEAKEKAEAEAARLEAEAKERAEKAPLIEKLNTWIEKMDLEIPPVENEVTAEIVNKFMAFKEWAKKQVNK